MRTRRKDATDVGMTFRTNPAPHVGRSLDLRRRHHGALNGRTRAEQKRGQPGQSQSARSGKIAPMAHRRLWIVECTCRRNYFRDEISRNLKAISSPIPVGNKFDSQHSYRIKMISMRRTTVFSAKWVIGCFLIASLVNFRADSVSLQPVADAEIAKGSPTISFGTNSTIVSGGLGLTVGNETRRGLFRFDLAGQVPVGSTVTSAVVTFAVVKVPLNPANSTFGLHRILQPWGETNATWTTRLSPDTPWEVEGAVGTADSVATASASAFISDTNNYAFDSTSNLLADVQLWADNPSTNFGWLLMSDAETELRSARHFAARESAAPPTLVVQFTPPTTALPPNIDLIERSSDTVNIRFTVQPTLTIALEYVNSLPSTNWTALTNAAAPVTPVTVNYSDSILSDPERFYRLRVTSSVR